MPRNVDISNEEEQAFEEGGGAKESTKRDKGRAYTDFSKFIGDQVGCSIPDQYEKDPEILSSSFTRYFWTMRVEVSELDDNNEKKKVLRRPKLGYASKIKSHIRMSVIEKHQIDLVDPTIFPNVKKRWQSFVDVLAKEGLADTTHFEEINPATVEKIFKLFNNLVSALEARGKEDYDEKLQLIPAKYHHKLNYVLQYMAQFLLTMFECRRGEENLNDFKKKDFKILEDDVFEFKYWKKVVSEQDKNHREGTNVDEVGVIPFKQMGLINPGVLFSWYMKFVPDQGTMEGKGGYLFPKPRDASRSFDVHDAGEMNFYQPNQPVGKNTIANMVPTLCDVVQEKRATNHMLRVTSIKYLRRSGMDWLSISKITGHKNLINLIKNYDLTLEGPGLVNVAAALATGPDVAQGDTFENVILTTKRSSQRPKPPPKNPPTQQSASGSRQPSFPATLQEQITDCPTRSQVQPPLSTETDEASSVHNSCDDNTGAIFELNSSIEIEASPPRKNSSIDIETSPPSKKNSVGTSPRRNKNSFGTSPPPNENSFGTSPPPNENSFGTSPPPNKNSFETSPPPNKNSFETSPPPPNKNSFETSPSRNKNSFETSPPRNKNSFETSLNEKRLKKLKKSEEKKRLGKLLEEFDRERDDKERFIKERYGREINVKEKKEFTQERMKIVWEILDSDLADKEDIYQAKIIDEQYRHEEKMESWIMRKEQEEKENENEIKAQRGENLNTISNRQPLALSSAPAQNANVFPGQHSAQSPSFPKLQPHMMGPPPPTHFQQYPFGYPMAHPAMMMHPMAMSSPSPYSMQPTGPYSMQSPGPYSMQSPSPYSMQTSSPYSMQSPGSYSMQSSIPYSMPSPVPYTMPSSMSHSMLPAYPHPVAPYQVASDTVPSPTPVPRMPSLTPAPRMGQVQSREVQEMSSNSCGSFLVTTKEVTFQNQERKQYQVRDLTVGSRSAVGSGDGDRKTSYVRRPDEADWSKKR